MSALYIALIVLSLIHTTYFVLAVLHPNNRKKKFNKESYSIEHIVCFKNETKFIEKKLKNCYELSYPDLHHTFVNDNSTDDTLELLEKYKGDNTNLISNDEDLGKNCSQIRSVRETNSDLILFTDANVFLEKNALDHIVSAFDEDTGGVCGNVTVTTDMSHQDMIGKYWETEKIIKEFQSSFGAVIGFDGGFYCVKRDCYNLTGKNQLSDFETAFLIFQQGKQTKYVRDAMAVEQEKRTLRSSFMARVRASNRVFSSFKRIFRYIKQLRRNIIIHFTFYKLVRYSLVILSVLSLPFIVADMIAISPFLLLVFAIPPVHRVIFESIALCIGAFLVLTGKEYVTWSNKKA